MIFHPELNSVNKDHPKEPDLNFIENDVKNLVTNLLDHILTHYDNEATSRSLINVCE